MLYTADAMTPHPVPSGAAPAVLSSAAELEDRLVHWLVHGPVRLADGGVLSWVNPRRPGFPYQEAAGLLLSLHAEAVAREGREDLRADGRLLAAGLRARLTDAGAVVHYGIRYVFDTAVVAAALDRWASVDGGPDGAVCRQFLRSTLALGRGQRGSEADDRWSLVFGPHLLKVALALPGERIVADLAERFCATAWDGAWFRTEPHGRGIYAHSHAYALEGLIALEAQGVAAASGLIDAGIRSLEDIIDRPETTSDVVAQTARLALLRGRDASGPIAALRARVGHGSAVRYRPGVDDLNSWASVFAAQALRWSRVGADPLWLA